ncbi:Splicing factor-like protein [Parasponia andersonii]|uniref:Splicing factor-like protein n=1 Tax=Parasponia andersonii TaxID=3476 RepID=A0A2P5CE43_PARAD|nr:Splicing factor-like protein [Parasponia andersonii]
MADAAPSSPATLELVPSKPQDQDQNPTATTTQSTQPNPLPASTTLPPPPPSTPSSSIPVAAANPSPNPTLVSPTPPPPLPPPPPPPVSYAIPPVSGVPPSAPSFRPVLQFTPMPNPTVPNPSYQNPSLQTPGVQPPGVSSATVMAPGSVSGGPGAVAIPVPQPLMPYQVAAPGQLPNPALRPPYAPMPNGFTAMTGLPRYPSPYPAMVRTPFPPRPPGGIGVLPRPPVPGIPGIRPIIPPVVRPAVVPSVTPADKPQTTVYVGKIAPTVENNFMLSLLQFCGAVKSWKRGFPRGFGFCEFETAEGVLRALRLLSKFNIDGQELVLNVNQATRDYLERYVEKKTESSKKVKETDAATAAKEGEGVVGDEKNDDLPSPAAEDLKKEDNDSGNRENDNASFGIVTDEDREADREALDKLRSMIEERLKTKPLPPPPAQAPGDGTGNLELPAKSRDGDSDADKNDAAEEKNDDESTSDNKQMSENDRPETSSPDKNRRQDRRSRERDRERDLRRDKEREIVRQERETERERIRKEREQRRRIEEAERHYEEYLKEWEYREREKEKQRQYEKDREKERERKRKKEIIYEEEEEDDDSRKRWRRSVLEEKRKKRLREKEDDLADKQKEDEEIAEAKRRADEERQQQEQKDVLKSSCDHVTNGTEKAMLAEESKLEFKDKTIEEDSEANSSRENRIGETILQNGGTSEESAMAPVAAIEMQHNGNVATKKLGFGLVGSGKRATVPSVFNEEDDEDAHKDKKMRPLVPIDYSTEELQAVQPTVSGATQPNLVAAAEFAKRLSNVGPKEEKPDTEKERSKRSRDRNDEDANRSKNETKEKTHDTDREHGLDKVKSTDNKKLLDAKQLIDMIPRTKEELFSYKINWAIYDKHALHERMRPWISKKITEFLGEEETTLVDYIVSSTQDHVEADRMLQLLQSILDEEAEMFVLKMWRMLIFEIKKVETGLSSRSRT